MLKSFFKRLIEARQAHADRIIARNQLWALSDRELHDIGIGRSDISRVVSEGRTTVRSST